MKLFVKVLFTATLLISNVTLSKTISDVEIADRLSVGNQNLVLNGAGVRSKLFFDLYVGSLYLPKKTSDFQKAMDSRFALIRLNITSGLITPEKMQNAVIEGFEAATHNQLAPLQTQIDEFIDLFESGIKEGDQFTFFAQKDIGITAFKNDVKISEIKGEAFRHALFAIWLGDKPAQKSLKKKMLGK
ncbi:chalcone isomerase [Parashewanella spongiae]|uniref:Chalcone isomerase n=1 Tax=Parashewanella spongiae TaxID=342950 RepID=A0A3A6TJZ7_9GAMM|nr:chalcone isomerase family protein [Parashewanella spongiae]MCL1077068.1 chalcone isomerase family protein [Parashewanella spongiae]RJY10451.1 chalcone isomerase [Parashewanella spongiae]